MAQQINGKDVKDKIRKYLDGLPKATAKCPPGCDKCKPPEAKPDKTTPKATAIPAGFTYPGGHVVESPRNDVLDAEAQRHAKYQASVQRQGHQGWGQRYRRLNARLGSASYAEIVAESWEEQVNATLDAPWSEMFKCWYTSSGHWRVASTLHWAFGSGMAVGRNGVWYAAIITQD